MLTSPTNPDPELVPTAKSTGVTIHPASSLLAPPVLAWTLQVDPLQQPTADPNTLGPKTRTRIPASMVHRLSPHEGDRLRTLRLRAVRDAPHAFASTAQETAAWPPENWPQQLRDLATFVVVKGGQDVGMVRGGPDQHDKPVAWLLSMWVSAEARGHGVGETLVVAVVDWAREAGFQEIKLEVGDHNAPAIALYARLGFVPTGKTCHLPPPRSDIREHERRLILV
jgi:GNAT superfamily N-acetyltransferase